MKYLNTVNEFKSECEKGILLVDFTASWCGPCQKIGPEFDKLPEKYPNLKFAKVDVDKAVEIAELLEISAMPTFKVFKNGQEIDELVGASLSSLIALCEKYNSQPS